MRKIIAAINTTLDAVCDHTAGIPDAELHQHYTELLVRSDGILYGRATFQLMEYWKTLLDNPSADKAMQDFAIAINNIPKIVFSNTLKRVDWKSARLAQRHLKEEVLELQTKPGRDILVGSRSIIIQLMNLNLIDELQLCIYPVITGSGQPLFENINHSRVLQLAHTKTFTNGAFLLYYTVTKNTA